MLGDMTFHPFSINTFSGSGRPLNPPIHYVHPHQVSSYRRSDGTFVRGYWRDGDGNTNIDRSTGYWSHNPYSLMKNIGKSLL